VQQNKESK